MIVRPQYLKVLRTYRDVPLVKILSGIRRCGKSTILEMLRADLLEDGVREDHIIFMRYTSEALDEAMTARAMYQGIKSRMADGGRYYLLLDEVQEVEDWEKAVNSLLEDADTDIYVTGSNSRLMSGEISTYLSGRYVSIPVYTLSFAEYLDFKKNSSLSVRQLLNEYLRYGGFPIIALGNFDERSSYQIAEGIYSSVITNDITRRHSIMNYDLFNRVVKFIIENVGKTFSANAIVKFLKSEGRSLSVEAVYNYLEWLEKAFVIYRCQRYDMQGKSVLKTQEKFYLADACLYLMDRYDGDDFFNVGYGREVTIRELAELIKKVTGYTGEIVLDASKPDGTPRKLTDISRIKALGWEPKIDLETGLKQTYEWFCERYESGDFAQR